MALRCLIVDDNARFLKAARRTLGDRELEVVGAVTTGEAALREVDELRPDVLLVDISLDDESGFDVAERLVERHPWLRSRIVLISTRSEDEYADLIERSPVVGFLAKSQLSADAVRRMVSASAG